jgi:acetoin utilization deacetylase AcuC-like enzyme
MGKVGLVYDPIYALHDTGMMHPEKSDRVSVTYEILKEHQMAGPNISANFVEISPYPATLPQILHIHSQGFIDRAQTASRRSKEIGDLMYLDGDTPVSPYTYEASLKAVGGNFAAIDAILAGQIQRAFVLCRPPGHHSNRELARGFCLFNNIALAADYLTREKGIKKVAILDFDCHAGNGTEEIFRTGIEHGNLLIISIHQDPRTLYPGTCTIEEIGEGKQKGKNVNITLAPESGDTSMMMTLTQLVEPLMTEFQPEFILCSAGFDGYKNDPITNLSLTIQGFGQIMQHTVKMANLSAHGRICVTLEGGYNITALANSIVNIMNIMADGDILEKEEEYLESKEILEYTKNNLIPKIRKVLSPYWNCFK